MSSSIKLSELNEFISCPVCHGYLIDATTVNECLHTFCKSCIVKHIKDNHNECPKCNTIIHERRPLDYIVYDRNKQDIVYKLVPQLYISELNRKISVRDMNDIDAMTRLVLKRKLLHVVLVQKRSGHNRQKYNQLSNTNNVPSSVSTSTASNSANSGNSSPDPKSQQQQQQPQQTQQQQQHDDNTSSQSDAATIYLKCPLTIQARHIRKLLAVKYQLEANDRINIFYKGDIVSDNDQISNLGQSLTFCLQYEISRICTTTVPKVVDVDDGGGSVDGVGVGREEDDDETDTDTEEACNDSNQHAEEEDEDGSNEYSKSDDEC